MRNEKHGKKRERNEQLKRDKRMAKGGGQREWSGAEGFMERANEANLRVIRE